MQYKIERIPSSKLLGAFDDTTIESALNSFAQDGWTVVAVTATGKHGPGSNEELLVTLSKQIG